MEGDSPAAAGQPNGNENGNKRPHESGQETDLDNAPDVKRARVDSPNDPDSELTQTQTKAAGEFKAGEPKSDGGALTLDAKVSNELNDARNPPKGTAVIKPE